MATFYTNKAKSIISPKFRKIQYRACTTITGAIHGTSKEKIYQELGLESLENRRWF